MAYDQEEYIKKFKLELAMMMGKGQKMKKTCLVEGVTRSEFFALQQIRMGMDEDPKNQGVYVSDLSKALQIALPAASRMLNSLEERGLIQRQINAKDRRNIHVSLTSLGEETRSHCYVYMDQLIERVIGEMGEQDACQLIELWKKFCDLIEVQMDRLEKEQLKQK